MFTVSYTREREKESEELCSDYNGHERENVVFEVVPVMSSHFDVDGNENFDVSLPRVRPFPPPMPRPTITAAAVATAGCISDVLCTPCPQCVTCDRQHMLFISRNARIVCIN